MLFSPDLISRKWQPTPVRLPGKSHGQRSLGGFSPWGHKESDKTERLHFPFLFPGSLSFTDAVNTLSLSETKQRKAVKIPDI